MTEQAGRAAGTALDVTPPDEARVAVNEATVQPRYSPAKVLALSGRSALALELSRLQLPTRRVLRLSDGALRVLDVFVTAVRIMIDDTDPRPLSERFEDAASWFPFHTAADDDGSDEDAFSAALHEMAVGFDELAKGDAGRLRRLQSGNFKAFVQKLVGPAHWSNLVTAAKEDGAIAFVAVRRYVRYVMPLAVALDDCAALLSPGQLAQVPGLGEMGESLLNLAFEFDGVLDKALEERLVTLQALPFQPREAEPRVADLGALTREVRTALDGMTRASLADVSERLSRKIHGARDALDHSADPVSQSANSQIEFIDRLLRAGFEDAAVVAWARERFPQRLSELVYELNGEARPTKKAQALCFVYAGGSINEAGTFQELAVAGLTKARGDLQKLKHADEGTAEELANCGSAWPPPKASSSSQCEWGGRWPTTAWWRSCVDVSD